MSFYKSLYFLYKNSSCNGQTIAEVLIGMTIGIGLIMMGVSLIVPSMNINKQVTNVQRGATLAKELLDNVRVFSESSWYNISSLATGTANTYYLNSLQSPFTIATGTEIVSVNPVTTGLAGWWKFDEGSGTVAFDSSGNSNNGTLSGTTIPTWQFQPNCPSGDCLSFNGSTALVNIGNPVSLQIQGSQTIALWIYPYDFSSRRNPYAKAFGGEGTITQETNGSLSYYYGTGAGNTTPYQGFNSGSVLQLNTWNYVTLVRDLTNMRLYWYKNGNLVVQTTASYPAASTSSLPVTIGAGYAGFYNGLIDDVRVYNRALSSAEINQIYTSGSFTRYFYVSDVYRDGGGYITTSGGTYDPSTKLITVVYSWLGGPVNQISMYLTRNQNNIYSQTDWSQGPGALNAATSVASQFATSSNINYTSTNGSISVSLPTP
jgi:hypothetical protein